MNRQRIRRAARKNAQQTAKVIQVQEAQIDALKARVAELETELAAADAALLGVLQLYGLFDHVDPTTGEVSNGRLS